MTVERVRVGDVLELKRREVEVEPGKEYVLVGIYSFGKGIFHREPTVGLDLGDYRFFRVEPDDLVLSNIQAWEGAIAHAESHDADTIGTHRFLTYTPVDNRIDTNWARWFFLSEPGMRLIRKAAPGTAVRNRTLAIKRFEALEIPLPPIEEQRQTAAMLDRIQARTEDLEVRSEAVRTLLGAIGPSLAARPDLSDEARAERGWQRVQLGSVMERTSDTIEVTPDSSYPNLGIRSFGRGTFEKPDIDGANTSARRLHRVRSGQFIYSRLFAFEGAYAVVPESQDGYFVSNEFPAFETDSDRLDAEWLAAYLGTPERWAELASESKGLGVRRQRVGVESMLAYEVVAPPIEEQRRVVKALDQLSEAHERRSRSDRRIASLVPAALNGEFGAVLR